MDKILIKISTDFADAPGARHRADGPNSGEEFFDTHLQPKFAKALEESKKLLIDFDDTWGYASSFISGAFGRLADSFGKKTVMGILEFKSNDDPSVIDKVKVEIAKSDNNA
jgi:hypothetical protein